MAKQRKPRRRSYGVGRKFQRGKIWWVAVYDGAGNEIRESTKSTEESAADDLLGRKLRERARGELVSIDSPQARTIGVVLDDFVHHCEESGKAPGTLATYKYQAELLLKPVFGLLQPMKLTTDMLTDYREARRKENVRIFMGRKKAPEGEQTAGRFKTLNRKVSDTSINRELGLLRSALRDLNKRRPTLMPTIPYFPMEAEHNARQGFISEADFINKLFPEFPRHLKALSACAFYCGGRKSEWLRVDWSEVDFENMLIRFIKTKNKHPREVPIVPGIMLDSLLEALRLKNAAWPTEPAVFVYDGKRLATIGEAWDKACARAGYPGLTFHDLRRSANKFMRDSGVGQNIRMKIMGHETPSMDLRYGIVDRNDIATARKQMGRETQLPSEIKKIG